MFTQDFILQKIYVKGEVSNCKYHTSGHIYFSLKDETGVLSCVMFAGHRRGLAFRMKDGDRVVVGGAVDVYERDGRYQLYAKEITLEGAGALYERFLALKAELEEMGMFAEEYKQPIPHYIHRLGVVTAPTGAAVQDIRNISLRRNPYLQIILYPALVQGEGAADSIVHGIHMLDQAGVDTIIVGRGGGSIEDLWAFNEEKVARAIFECRTPIISAVGHETDFTIADFVADHRAPTPTGAAEMAVPNLPDVLKHFNQLNVRLNHNFNVQFEQKKNQLAQLSNHYIMKNPHALFEQRLMHVNQLNDKLQFVLQDQLTKRKAQFATDYHRLIQFNPMVKVDSSKQHVAFLTQQLKALMSEHLSEHKQNYHVLLTKLEMLNPLSILKKGYSVITDENEEMITTVQSMRVGQIISVALDDGTVKASIKEIQPSESN